jgi:hypothetical protein
MLQAHITYVFVKINTSICIIRHTIYGLEINYVSRVRKVTKKMSVATIFSL